MINWDELKHIHVIRKLEDILGHWFKTDVFFVDERGKIQNYDPEDRQRQFRNPFAQLIFSEEASRTEVQKVLANASETLYESNEKILEIDGPFGAEKFCVVPVMVDQEFLGCVCAYSYVDQAVPESALAAVKAKAEAWTLDGEQSAQGAQWLKVLEKNEKKYFFELVNLVAEEIITFHTEISKREERISELNSELGSRYKYNSMIGKSKKMQEIYSLLDKIKSSDSTVLIQGSNGTGKELIAKAIHYNSSKKDMPFITVNCSAFNDNLLDSELFGHVKGAFTGAMKDKKGLFEAANHGTLFLDEIGDMTLSMQVKLLRVLQEGTLTPVGSTEQKKVVVRILAATNKDLKDMVERGDFREDLYYRINVINLVVPRLRDRKEDIPLLLDHFLVKSCKEKSVSLKTIAKRTMEKLLDYPWQGNIRELENEVERLVVLSGDDQNIKADMLSPRIRDFGGAGKVQGVRVTGKLKDALEELEKTMIKEGLRRTNWNKSRLAKELGISRAGLIMKVEKYALDKRKLTNRKTG